MMLAESSLGDYAVMRMRELVVRDAPDLVSGDDSGDRILDLGDGPDNAGVDVDAILEGAVACLVECAILQDDTVHVAQRLLSGDVAAYQTHVLGMPAKILSVEDGIIYGDILALPERILGDNLRIVHLHILAVLENILRVALQSVYIYVAAEHERVSPVMQLHVLELEIIYPPEGLVGIVDHDILQRQTVHLPEKLRTVDHAVSHNHIIAVPYGGTGSGSEVAIGDHAAVNMPQRVFTIKLASSGFYVGTALDPRFSIRDDDILQSAVADSEQRPLPAEGGVLDCFHSYLAIL